MELILVRHAQPATGRTAKDRQDPSLSAVGQRQAERLAVKLADESISAVVTSPSLRAVETIAPLSLALGIRTTVVADLREYEVPVSEYVSVEELKAAGGPEWQRIRAGDLPSSVDGLRFRERAVAAVEALTGRYAGRQHVVVACHSGVINAYLSYVLASAKALPFPLDYGSISRVHAATDGLRVVRTVNDSAHLHHVDERAT